MRHLNENYLNGNDSTIQIALTHETSKVQLFNNPDFGKIRTVEVNNQPYFVGNDVAKVLGYIRPNDAILQHVDNEDTVKHRISDNQGVPHNYTLINESGVYSLVFSSKLPTAKKFKHWVTNEVLPTIRKHGAYATETTIDSIIANPENGIKLLQALQKEREEKRSLEIQNSKLQPKANFADAVFATDDKVDIGMSAKILKLGFGRNKLFAKLKEAGVFFSNRNEPKQRFIDAGYFEMTEKFIQRKEHPGFVVTKVLVTQKGLAYINHLFGGKPSDGKLTKIL